MKKEYSFEEISEKSSELVREFQEQVQGMIQEQYSFVTLDMIKKIRGEFFYEGVKELVREFEEVGRGYDFEVIGRFSLMLKEDLQNACLEFVL